MVEISPLAPQDIFGIFFIVLIIQFAFDLFPKKRDENIVLRYIGIFLFSASISAIFWRVVIPLMMNNCFWNVIVLGQGIDKCTSNIIFYAITIIMLLLGLGIRRRY